MSVVLMRHRCRLCAASGWDVLEPGEPNVPAGTRELDEWDVDQ